jgi:hypothetical protein
LPDSHRPDDPVARPTARRLEMARHPRPVSSGNPTLQQAAAGFTLSA